jgi:hypothetical protein
MIFFNKIFLMLSYFDKSTHIIDFDICKLLEAFGSTLPTIATSANSTTWKHVVRFDNLINEGHATSDSVCDLLSSFFTVDAAS